MKRKYLPSDTFTGSVAPAASLLESAGNRFQMERYFAVIIVLMALGALITGGLRFAENRMARWRVLLRDAR